jgi:hypothetical protein
MAKNLSKDEVFNAGKEIEAFNAVPTNSDNQLHLVKYIYFGSMKNNFIMHWVA